MNMTSIDTASLLWSLLFSSIGLGYFIYGKKQSNAVVRYVGIALIVYPYFVHNPLAMVLIGLGLMFVPKFT
jgi:hypothetical protein